MAKQRQEWIKKDEELEIKEQVWEGYTIRFIYAKGEWWAVLKDMCDALNLDPRNIPRRLDVDMLLKVPIKSSNVYSTHVRSKGDNKVRWMYVVSEYGIYEALFTSRKLEARQFRRWTYEVLKKLRENVGLEAYEVFRMTEPEIQEDILWMLDSIYYDEETGKVMQSVTLPGGDVDQVEL